MGRNGLGAPGLAAIEAVARRFSATWEAADGASPDAWLTLDGRRIAVEVVAVGAGTGDEFAKPRLRFDRVALRLVDGLRASLSPLVPDGEAVVVTGTAPIRLAAKTADSLEGRVRDALARRPETNLEETNYGNQVRVRFVTGVSRRAPKVAGFVHNPDPAHAALLLDLTQSLLRQVGAAAERRPPEAFTGDRWLVVAEEARLTDIETYRRVYAQIAPAAEFKQALIVLAGGRVETLTG
jgi:hypothetical protein